MTTHSCKLVVIGDSGVGKSSLVRTYLLNLNNYNLDHWCCLLYRRIRSYKNANMGYYRSRTFRSICPIYFRGSSDCICVFDVTNKKF